MKKKFHSNGKLLISGEYAILDGALGLAIPTSYGQSLGLVPTTSGMLDWKSYDRDGQPWFTAEFDIGSMAILSTSHQDRAKTLQGLLREAQRLNPLLMGESEGIEMETHLEFPRNWGLGSSSTLIDNLAQWARVDPYALLWNAFGGSGYDIACARHNAPITYRLGAEGAQVREIDFDPIFKDSLYFVHLNEKQSSKEAIEAYRSLGRDKEKLIQMVTELTQRFIVAGTLAEFETLMGEHEALLSGVLGLPPVKGRLFADYPGMVKSLGAWGGDFVLASGDQGSWDYFRAKGYPTVIPYGKMIL